MKLTEPSPALVQGTQEYFAAGLRIEDPASLKRWLRTHYREPGANTVEKYKAIYMSMKKNNKCGIYSASTLKVIRSAIQYMVNSELLSCPDHKQDKLRAYAELWKRLAAHLLTPVIENDRVCQHQGFLRMATFLRNHGFNVDGPISRGFPRREPRVKKIRGLCQLWREIFLENIETNVPNMLLAVMTLALTGCRPKELSQATFTRGSDGNITIEFDSVKGSAGFRRGGIYKEEGHVLKAMGLLESQSNDDSYPLKDIKVKQIENLLARTSRKKVVLEKLGKRICASCFRNQAASDAKAAGFSDEELAKFLGHITNLEQRAYGRASLGSRRGQGWLPFSVLASHEVKLLETRYPRGATSGDQDEPSDGATDWKPKG